MAEILIQRRRHRNVWPWLLGLLALALLPLPFLGNGRSRERARPERRVARTGARPHDTATARGDTAAREDTTAPRAVAASGARAGGGAQRGTTAGGTRESGAAGSDTTTGRASVAAASGPAVERPAAGRAEGRAPAASRTTGIAAGAVAVPTAPGAATRSGGAIAAYRGTPPAPANEFERFIAARRPSADERLDRDFTADALRRLATELHALGASDAGVRTIRGYADSLQSTGAPSRAHPDEARAAFLAAVHELDVLRARYRAPVDTGRLRTAAWSIQPDQRLVAQRGRVQSFFEAAADALRSLTRFASRRTR